MAKDTRLYGDWRDDIEPRLLHMGDSQFASPMCPDHGWLGMRKKKVSVWKCMNCDYTVKVDEVVYREWRERMSRETHLRNTLALDKLRKEMEDKNMKTIEEIQAAITKELGELNEDQLDTMSINVAGMTSEEVDSDFKNEGESLKDAVIRNIVVGMFTDVE